MKKFLLKLVILIFLQIVSNIPSCKAGDLIEIRQYKGMVKLNIKIEQDSIIYWYKKAAMGLPTAISIKDQENVSSYAVHWPWPHTKIDNGHIIAYYSDNIIIPIEIHPQNPALPLKCKLVLSYLSCGNLGCIPKSYEHIILMQEYKESNESTDPKNIKIIEEITYKDLRLIVKTSCKNTNLLIMQDTNLYLPSKKEIKENSEYFYFDAQILKEGLIEIHNNQNTDIEYFDISASFLKNQNIDDKQATILNTSTANTPQTGNNMIASESYSFKESLTSPQNITQKGGISPLLSEIYTIIPFALTSLIGGFILNFMPCVLPILSLKLYSFSNLKSTNARINEAIISIITIIGYFLFLGLLTYLAKESGELFFAGKLMQMPEVISLSLIMMIFMICALRGKITLTPNIALLDKLSFSSHYVQIAFTTLVTTILATPCTGPYLGWAITFAISQGSLVTIMLIFLFSGIGFAAPYFAVMFYPSILSFLPKQGAWQPRIQLCFFLLIFVTMVWLFFILSNLVTPWKLYATIFISGLIFYILEANFIKKPIIISILIVSCILIHSMKYDDQTKSNLASPEWERFSEEKVRRYLQDNQKILIYVTAKWCATCQINKFMVLDSKKTIEFLKSNKIKLLEADMTTPDNEIETFLQLQKASGIPYTLAYAPPQIEGVVLPVLFTLQDLMYVFTSKKQ
ncbi:MAG: hypothetical protein EB127_08335 [Alphaproteobacteria bacterium]|nr:hypothetical protein [Alphaproteobacteria bacterium]